MRNIEKAEPGKVVFSTSCIQSFYQYGVFRSRGKLETAMVHGYQVYVVTTRKLFNTHDRWWMELVGDNVFAVRGDLDNGHPHATGIFDAFRRFYAAAGLSDHWQSDWTGGQLVYGNSPDLPTWMEVEWKLSKLGFFSGCSVVPDARYIGIDYSKLDLGPALSEIRNLSKSNSKA